MTLVEELLDEQKRLLAQIERNEEFWDERHADFENIIAFMGKEKAKEYLREHAISEYVKILIRRLY